MGLQLTSRETLYHRKQFYENMIVHGISCRIYSLKRNDEEAYDFYNDIRDEELSYDDNFIESRINYEELPTIKTLKSLGWYIDGENFPAIGYIPVVYMDKDGQLTVYTPQKDDKIVVVANPVDDNSSVRSFLLKDFVGNGFPNVIYYTCNMVPFYEEVR